MYKKLFYSLLFFGIILTDGAIADISDGLIGWWMFDEGAGSTVADSSGAGHDGFFVDNEPEWVPGMYGTALDFDGTDKVEIPDHGDFHLTNAMSLALWMQPEGEQASSAKLFIKQKSGQYPYSLQYDDSGEGVFATVYASTRYDTAPHIPDFPGEWAHMCFTYDGSVLILYKDGEEAASVNTSGQLQQNNLSLSIGCRLDYAQNFNGIIDDVRLFNRELSPDEINQIMIDAPALSVTDPNPADGATDVLRDVILSWVPIEVATQHDIYFGTDALAVANADTSDTTGVYRGRLMTNSFILTEMLEYGQTYYWRVDEIGAPPENTMLKGNLWSFTTELLIYPIEHIIATASSSEDRKDPENTINGSGLDSTGLLHGNISIETMWLSSWDGEQPTWIQYEFDSIYKLDEMWVWNSNDSLEPMIGLGFKDVTIEYSTDSINFMTLGTTHEFAMGTGTDEYAHNTTIDFQGVAAKFVKLTANSNWKSILNQYGLSEVRFFHIPIRARNPQPAAGTEDVGLSVTLTWTAGREAVKHDVYFSDDLQAVEDGSAFLTTTTDTSYGPLALDLNKTYYWRVDEVNDAEAITTWPGESWYFTTMDSILVDDFEGYTDEDTLNEAIWQTWIDGYGVPENGSQVGYLFPPYAERAIIHSGLQSMPLAYDNTTASYSEATAAIDSLASSRDWTLYGIENLSLWFRGYPASVGGFVEGPAGTYTMTAAGADIWNQADEFHFAYKQLAGTGSIVARVESMDPTNPWAKAGVMIRETLDAGSKFAGIFITPTDGCSFQARTETDSAAISDGAVWTAEQRGISAPYWVKLERDVTGSLKGYYASDGVNWRPMIWKPGISMSSNVYIGLALTSHDVALTCQAVFSGVQTTGTVSGQWQSQDIGILSNSAESIYVEIANSTGAPAAALHGDPSATQIDAWTEWIIPLQVFADQGVNLTDVDRISIGVGNKDNPQPGGTGTLYIDDIRLD